LITGSLINHTPTLSCGHQARDKPGTHENRKHPDKEMVLRCPDPSVSSECLRHRLSSDLRIGLKGSVTRVSRRHGPTMEPCSQGEIGRHSVQMWVWSIRLEDHGELLPCPSELTWGNVVDWHSVQHSATKGNPQINPKDHMSAGCSIADAQPGQNLQVMAQQAWLP
jgi:hypothetical protein